jgi:hypothetical protein
MQYEEVKQFTEEQAKNLYKSGFWKNQSYEERAKFQMMQDRLCMPIDVFMEALNKYLGRPVYTHELMYSNKESLMAEVFDGAPAPTLREIIELIPRDKLLLIEV